MEYRASSKSVRRLTLLVQSLKARLIIQSPDLLNSNSQQHSKGARKNSNECQDSFVCSKSSVHTILAEIDCLRRKMPKWFELEKNSYMACCGHPRDFSTALHGQSNRSFLVIERGFLQNALILVRFLELSDEQHMHSCI